LANWSGELICTVFDMTSWCSQNVEGWLVDGWMIVNIGKQAVGLLMFVDEE